MPISVLLADDNLIVREGVRALLEMEPDLEVAGVAADYDELMSAADSLLPQVVVTDIRMPPAFRMEGIEAAKAVRKRHPGTGVVVLSQYDDPEYVISLVDEGAAGVAYLLKDRVAEGNQLARAIRAVSTGGSMLDPKVVEALIEPVWTRGGLTTDEEKLLSMLPSGIAEDLRSHGRRAGDSEMVVATILISDVRGYSSIAERGDPGELATLLSEHRAEMSRAVETAGGIVMHFMGDGLLAVFGAPVRLGDHADRALAAARNMHARQDALNERWRADGLPPFEIGIGVSTGEVAAALLGSDERLEYTVVGDVVNLAQRLQETAGGGETVLSEASVAALREDVEARLLEPAHIRGKSLRVTTFLVERDEGKQPTR